MNENADGPIDQVIADLQALVSWSETGPDSPSRIGYFASLYLRVTDTIRSKTGTGYFDDDARMERLDAAFAQRYLAAVNAFQNDPASLAPGWAVALDATNDSGLIIVQQLFLAMNPHINIDLAIAAVETCPGTLLDPLQSDFMKITDVLGGIVPTVVAQIGELSPLIGLLNYLDENGEVEALNFSMQVARDSAWLWAVQLNPMSDEERSVSVAARNEAVVALSDGIVSPGEAMQGAVDAVRAFEADDVGAIIRALDNGNSTLQIVPSFAKNRAAPGA